MSRSVKLGFMSAGLLMLHSPKQVLVGESIMQLGQLAFARRVTYV